MSVNWDQVEAAGRYLKDHQGATLEKVLVRAREETSDVNAETIGEIRAIMHYMRPRRVRVGGVSRKKILARRSWDRGDASTGDGGSRKGTPASA